MKQAIILICTISFAFSFSQVKKDKNFKTKTFKTDSIQISYPKKWRKSGAHGYIFFRPKGINRNSYEDELEHVSVNKNFIPLHSKQNIEYLLNRYAEKIYRFEVNKSFKISKISNHEKFIYKIESKVDYSLSEDTYKKVEYFFLNGKRLESYRYQIRKELFDKYHDDAMAIINSIERR